jgi:hypothetical protein
MARRALLSTLVLGFVITSGFGQNPPAPNPSAVQEFPVILHKGVTAGKTPAGTKLEAELVIATLVNGTVIPKKAMLSGEVVDSVAKTRTEPSRLSIRIDSATWKNGSAPLKLYLTAWFYPSITESGQDLRYGPEQPASRTWNGAGEYPGADTRGYKPMPGDSDKGQAAAPDTPNTVASKHPVLMKDVSVEVGTDGSLALVSKRSNLKLDPYTTYVLATGDLLSKK